MPCPEGTTTVLTKRPIDNVGPSHIPRGCITFFIPTLVLRRFESIDLNPQLDAINAVVGRCGEMQNGSGQIPANLADIAACIAEAKFSYGFAVLPSSVRAHEDVEVAASDSVLGAWILSCGGLYYRGFTLRMRDDMQILGFMDIVVILRFRTSDETDES